ncbi:type IV pilus modification protein PilV [Alcanivorax sediminis]|uniref:Type IV pilus modification protein PilV n=1 Tax=Alcanivorax sediminis TaxID=2663008 RepID=A0A6N7M0D2_9GAMM|nr:type IV pilus modification protein PilV [Alcanivorax sediminis]MQX54835.1 type IV pilus modification protein PilV [Alcanivorax sediminis]
MTAAQRPNHYRQRGFGLVEVLVALLVLSIGILGYAGLQLQAISGTESAHYRTQAIAIADDLAERIAANPESEAAYLDTGNWTQQNFPSAKPAGWDTCTAAACTPDAMATNDILQISTQAAQLLPGGQVSASACAGSSATCITVTWNDQTPATCTPPDDDCIRLEVVTWVPAP